MQGRSSESVGVRAFLADFCEAQEDHLVAGNLENNARQKAHVL